MRNVSSARGKQLFRIAMLGIVALGASLRSTAETRQYSLSKTSSPAVTLSPTALGFGSVSVGSAKALTLVVSNTGTQSYTLSKTSVSLSGFTVAGLSLPVNVAGGQKVSLQVSFAPQTTGSVSAMLSLTFTYYKRRTNSVGTMTASVPLSGSGIGSASGSGTATLNPTPTSLSFGTVQAGTSKSMAQSLQNSGTASATISQIVASGSGFAVSGVSLPVTISAGQSYTFNVTFTPTTAGSASGSLSVLSNASNSTVSIPLSGSEATQGQLSVAPGSVSFGSVVVGTSTSQTASLSASGSSVTISSIGTSDPEFTVSGVSLPFTISAGTSKAFTVTFTPKASGSVAANLAFASNATASPIAMAVSGSGTAPVQHSVSLSWSPSSSANVIGYNIYRSGVSGGPYAKINSSLDSATTDTDLAVVSGQTYYYVVTAVNSSNVESGYSGQVAAVVP